MDGEFKITKREILVSISIVAILVILGLFISSKISEAQMDKNEVYNKALKVKSSDMFKYGMQTNIGNAFVYGDLKAVDTVTYPEIGGAYMYAEKVKEEYTRHTRQVAHTSGSGKNRHTYYTTEVYYTWDAVSRNEVKCKQISFLDATFTSDKIKIPSAEHIKMIQESGYVRYQYYGTPVKHTGTIFTKLSNNTINGTTFYEDATIDKVMQDLESDVSNIIFWVVWIIFIIACVIGFYYLNNRWLE